jgi:protein TonB
MFEQSILIERSTKTGWSVLLSLTLQLVCLSTLVILPLIFTDHLSTFQWSNILVAPAPPALLPPVTPRVTATRSASSGSNTLHAFVAPTRIPDHVSMTADAAPPPSLDTGVTYSTGALNAAAGAIGDLIRATAPPPPPPAPPKIAEPAISKPISVSGGVQNAKLIRKVLPVYPPLARQARISGTVRLVGIIGKDGTIKNLQLVSGHPLLVDAAFQAVRQWIYQPTLLTGQPVEVIAPIDVIFTLSQ